MRRYPLLALVIAAFLTGAALRAQDTAAQKELKKLEGTWRVAAMERDGQKVPEEEYKDLRAVVQGNTYTYKQGDKVTEKGTFQIDPSKKPMTITITPTEGPDKGKTMKGIYELQGKDTVRFCGAGPGKERPTDFSAKAGSGRTLITYQRVPSK